MVYRSIIVSVNWALNKTVIFDTLSGIAFGSESSAVDDDDTTCFGTSVGANPYVIVDLERTINITAVTLQTSDADRNNLQALNFSMHYTAIIFGIF